MLVFVPTTLVLKRLYFSFCFFLVVGGGGVVLLWLSCSRNVFQKQLSGFFEVTWHINITAFQADSIILKSMTSEGNSALFSGEFWLSTAVARDFLFCITTSAQRRRNLKTQRSPRSETLFSHNDRFRKTTFSKCFPSIQKHFQIPPVRKAFSELVWTVR